MIARRVWTSVAGPKRSTASPSGPRWRSSATIAWAAPEGADPAGSRIAPMPHIPRRVWQGHRPHLRGSGIVSGVTDRDLQLPSGRVRLRTWDPGSPDGDVPVLCVHALSSTVMTFHELAPALAAAGRRVYAFDLRGRGHSEDTGLGTYGWPAHARDVLD